MRRMKKLSALSVLTTLIGCGAAPDWQSTYGESVQAIKSADDATPDSIGRSATVSPTAIDQSTNNPFFHVFGTNGRTCGTCHTEATGWTITPGLAQSRPANDPLFVFDGSDCLPPGVSNSNPTANSKQMLAKANVRIEIGIPASADYTLLSFTDPLDCPIAPGVSGLRMYRRPLPTANSAFLATVMWDGRENTHPPNNTVNLIFQNLKTQSNDATRGHAQATSDLPDETRSQMVTFETNIFNAQTMVGCLNLKARGANGGAEFLIENTLPSFYIGINDVLNCSIPNSCQPGKTARFSNIIFTVFRNWEDNPPTNQAAAVGRGEKVFNTKTFPIDNVAGINRDPGDPVGAGVVFNGFCGTCHDSPNVGNHSTSLPIDIGIAASPPVGGLDVAQLPTYTFQESSTGRTITVTDPGRGLITGKFRDIGKFKGPTLRALATRAPYFHNGSARDLASVVNFYDARFHIGFTVQEKSDLAAFLQGL